MGIHLFPFRTEKLSPIVPMVLPSGVRVGNRHFREESHIKRCDSLFVCYLTLAQLIYLGEYNNNEAETYALRHSILTYVRMLRDIFYEMRFS